LLYNYRYNKLAIKVAGLREIHVNGVENINFSDTVKKHTDYCLNMPDILQSINLLGAPDPSNIFMHSSSSSSSSSSRSGGGGGDSGKEEETPSDGPRGSPDENCSDEETT
jgi:hypothetical protein